MKKRNRKISYKEMRALMRELRTIAKYHGVEVVVHRKSAFATGELRCYANGFYDIRKHRAVVTVYGRPSRRAVLAAVAHEVRHGMHVNLGLYDSYYQDIDRKIQWNCWKKLSKIPINLGVAKRAEQDCDRWADKWLEGHNIRPYNEEYPSWMTLHHRIKDRISYLRSKDAG